MGVDAAIRVVSRFFVDMVSTLSCSVAVIFSSFDVFSPIVSPVLYINRSGIRCGLQEWLGMGVDAAIRVISRFLLTR